MAIDPHAPTLTDLGSPPPVSAVTRNQGQAVSEADSSGEEDPSKKVPTVPDLPRSRRGASLKVEPEPPPNFGSYRLQESGPERDAQLGWAATELRGVGLRGAQDPVDMAAPDLLDEQAPATVAALRNASPLAREERRLAWIYGGITVAAVGLILGLLPRACQSSSSTAVAPLMPTQEDAPLQQVAPTERTNAGERADVTDKPVEGMEPAPSAADPATGTPDSPAALDGRKKRGDVAEKPHSSAKFDKTKASIGEPASGAPEPGIGSKPAAAAPAPSGESLSLPPR